MTTPLSAETLALCQSLLCNYASTLHSTGMPKHPHLERATDEITAAILGWTLEEFLKEVKDIEDDYRNIPF
jgi:hypothetical protein